MTNELEERSKKRKARRNRRRLFSLLGFILLLIYIPALWNWAFSVNYEIGVIRTATLEVKVPVQTLFIRKELIMNSPGDGILIPEINNGERVSKGEEVASYIQADIRDVVENYRQMELEILKRVVEKFDKASGSERETWETAIEKQITKLTNLSNGGNLSDADSIRSSVDRVLEAKARYMLENGSLIDSLKNEKKELERLRGNIEKSINSVKAPISGIVSYQLDGYEDRFTPEQRNEVTLEQISELAESEDLHEKWLTPSEISVKRDEVYGKLVTNDEAWIALRIQEERGKDISVAFEKAKLDKRELIYDLEVEGLEERIPVVLEAVGPEENGFRKLTVKMTKFIERTMNLRSVEGNLILQSVTGMKVPLRSLFNENTVDNTADIAIVVMNKAVFKRVQIIGRQDSYAIIENIDPTNAEKSVQIFDVYLVNPKNVVEGQVVEK